MNCSQNAIQLRLQALHCPLPTSSSEQTLIQKHICWLEDVHIRRQPIPHRTALRACDFRAALNGYLRLLHAPAKAHASPSDARNFLLDLAINLHFSDNAVRYNAPHDPWHGRCIPVVSAASESHKVLASAEKLRVALQLPRAPDLCSAAICSAAADVVDVVRGSTGNHHSSAQLLSTMPIGFDIEDQQLHPVVCAMRLLYVRRLRALQDEINSIISDMQTLTADPKTDSSLGRVGR